MADMNVTYGDINNTASQLRAGKDQMEQQLAQLVSAVSTLTSGGFVTDHASVAFHDTFDKYQTGLKQAVDALEGMAQFLDQSAKAMEETDTQLASAIQNQG